MKFGISQGNQPQNKWQQKPNLLNKIWNIGVVLATPALKGTVAIKSKGLQIQNV